MAEEAPASSMLRGQGGGVNRVDEASGGLGTVGVIEQQALREGATVC